MAITNKKGIEKHTHCNMIILLRYHKGYDYLRPGLYCEDHKELIQWLNNDDYMALLKMGVEELQPTPEDIQSLKDYCKTIKWINAEDELG
jgi:hypothetical protein